MRQFVDTNVCVSALLTYPGYKFETLSLMPDQWDPTSRDFIESREEMVVTNHAQYCSVVKTGIGKAKMVLGGEVDALWDCKPEKGDLPINWVELKTSAAINNDKDALKYERKLLKFWIQSFLLGVPKIVVGFRSKNGILQSLEELETKDIPGNVKRRGKGTWDGNLCINFTANFLDCKSAKQAESFVLSCCSRFTGLKENIHEDGTWRIRRRERSPVIELFKVEESGYGDILSADFVEWRTGPCQNKET